MTKTYLALRARTQVPRLEIWQKSFTRKYDARRAEWLNLERLKTAVLGIISEDEKELRKPRNRKLVALYVHVFFLSLSLSLSLIKKKHKQIRETMRGNVLVQY